MTAAVKHMARKQPEAAGTPTPAQPRNSQLRERFPARPAQAWWPCTAEGEEDTLRRLTSPTFLPEIKETRAGRRRGTAKMLRWLSSFTGDTAWPDTVISADAAGTRPEAITWHPRTRSSGTPAGSRTTERRGLALLTEPARPGGRGTRRRWRSRRQAAGSRTSGSCSAGRGPGPTGRRSAASPGRGPSARPRYDEDHEASSSPPAPRWTG